VGPRELLDLSANGSSFALDEHHLHSVSTEPVTVELLGSRRFSTTLDLVRTVSAAQARTLRVCSRFATLTPPAMQVLSEFLIRSFADHGRLPSHLACGQMPRVVVERPGARPTQNNIWPPHKNQD
jgi:hypothetical protein